MECPITMVVTFKRYALRFSAQLQLRLVTCRWN